MPALMPTSCSMHLTQHTLAPLSLRFAPTFPPPPLCLFIHIYSSCPLSLRQDFVTALSILLRGSITEKLQWTFNLYDINRDGYINKEVVVLPNGLCGVGITNGASFVLKKQISEFCVSSVWQEMTDIVKAIYDMMGKYTYPVLKTDAPKQHVDAFFQVTCSRLLFNFNKNPTMEFSVI